MKTTIYSITNPIGEVYIGSTKSKLRQRVNEHKYNLKRKRKGKIYDSFNKYGFGNHIVKELLKTTEEDRFELEHFIIETFEPKLNITKKYNATALNKFWVNYNGKEFQVYKNDILPHYKIGRIKKIILK
jgi:group I intron endonuclease